MIFVPILDSYETELLDVMTVEFPRGINIHEMQDFVSKTISNLKNQPDFDGRMFENGDFLIDRLKEAIKVKYHDFVVDFASENEGYWAIWAD